MSPIAAPARELCDRIAAFERADFSAEVKSTSRHWVEVHWLGRWLDFDRGWGLECRHSPDEPSKALCAWLVDGHTDFEFHDRLPRAILICHGYRFPDLSYWDDWKSAIRLSSRANRSVLLEIDQTAHKAADIAIRLSVVPEPSRSADQPLPPLFKPSDVVE
ncbi:MAG: hypothetical protein ACR2FH_11450 [Caulobacteraceae bacterium]